MDYGLEVMHTVGTAGATHGSWIPEGCSALGPWTVDGPYSSRAFISRSKGGAPARSVGRAARCATADWGASGSPRSA